MNSLTKKYIDDVLPYVKPERRGDIEEQMLRNARECGDIVRIEDTHSKDGQRVIERTYYHENGLYGVMTAVQAGVESLPA
jgi:hypothetical protein